MSLQILTVSYDYDINLGCAVGLTCKAVMIAGRASPQVGVSRRENDVVRIRPVVIKCCVFTELANESGPRHLTMFLRP